MTGRKKGEPPLTRNEWIVVILVSVCLMTLFAVAYKTSGLQPLTSIHKHLN